MDVEKKREGEGVKRMENIISAIFVSRIVFKFLWLPALNCHQNEIILKP
jgi:hypothetical protein